MRIDRVEHGPPAGHSPEAGTRDAAGGTPARQAGRAALIAVTLVGVMAAGIWAYSANTRSTRPAMDMSMRVTSGSTPFPVAIAPVERGPMAGGVTYAGTVAAFSEEDIYPRVTGRIVEMPVYPGDAVRPGQIVARLDDVELSSRARESESMVTTAQANRAQMEADLAVARQGIVQMERELAMVEAELGYARGVAARSERLVGVGAISRQEYESDRSMATSLEAKREAARAKLEQARAMEVSAGRKLEAAASMVTQSQAQLRTAQVVRDYVRIAAPSGGYVIKRLVAPGVLVQPGTAILKIAQVDRVRLQANVGEKDLPSIRVGSPVTAAAGGQPPLTAHVTSIFPFIDQGSRTAVVEAVVDNAARRLLPGQYVTIQFTTGERADAVRVPRGAVARLGGQATVWVVSGDRAEPRQVETGLQSPERVEIMKGLGVGERIVVRGHEVLYAGARVTESGGTAPAPSRGSDLQKDMPGMPGMSEPPAARPPDRAAAPPAAPPGARGGAHGGH